MDEPFHPPLDWICLSSRVDEQVIPFYVKHHALTIVEACYRFDAHAVVGLAGGQRYYVVETPAEIFARLAAAANHEQEAPWARYRSRDEMPIGCQELVDAAPPSSPEKGEGACTFVTAYLPMAGPEIRANTWQEAKERAASLGLTVCGVLRDKHIFYHLPPGTGIPVYEVPGNISFPPRRTLRRDDDAS